MRTLPMLPAVTFAALSLLAAGCQRQTDTSESVTPTVAPAQATAPVTASTDMAAATPAATALAATGSTADDPALVAALSAERDRIEGKREQLQKREVRFDAGNSDAQIRQKWQKMHVYSEDGRVVRIKTYPQGASKRTEEFYFKDGALAVAFIEDEGLEQKAGADGRGKTFWFSGGRLLKTQDDTGESAGDATAMEAGGGQLQQEAREYLEIAGKGADTMAPPAKN